MPDQNENRAAEAAAETIPVLCRFTRAELDAMQLDTGATADATAVACYCRRRLRADNGQ